MFQGKQENVSSQSAPIFLLSSITLPRSRRDLSKNYQLKTSRRSTNLLPQLLLPTLPPTNAGRIFTDRHMYSWKSPDIKKARNPANQRLRPQFLGANPGPNGSGSSNPQGCVKVKVNHGESCKSLKGRGFLPGHKAYRYIYIYIHIIFLTKPANNKHKAGKNIKHHPTFWPSKQSSSHSHTTQTPTLPLMPPSVFWQLLAGSLYISAIQKKKSPSTKHSSQKGS